MVYCLFATSNQGSHIDDPNAQFHENLTNLFRFQGDIASTGKLVSDNFVRRNVTPKVNEVIFGAYPGTAALYTVVVTTR